MAQRARIFSNGGSQAVRLPESCRFPAGQDEVLVRRVGRCVILDPADEWSSEFTSALGGWSDDIECPRAESISKKKDPFG